MPGRAEQDPAVYWESLVKACRALEENHPELFRAVAGIGVTTQRNTMINVDAEGRILRPAVTWLDQRKAPPVFGASGLTGAALKLIRLQKKVLDVQSRGACNWIMARQPDIWDKTHKYLQVSGFLNWKLTGNFSDSDASQIGHIPFDYKKRVWAKGLSLPRILFPVPGEKLPDLVRPGGVIGSVTQTACLETGLGKGIPVFACGSDKGCETLGNGVVDETMVSLSFGTSATVQTMSHRYYEPIVLMPPYPAPVEAMFNPEIEIFRGFWMLTWFAGQFAGKEMEMARKQGVAVETLLNEGLERTHPGAMGLVVQPYWGPGLERPHAKGAMIGFGDVHTRDHIYRAVIEGLGFALFEGMKQIEKKGKVKKIKAAVSGGASQSDAVCRIVADIFNLPMNRVQTHDTSGLGAAIVTAAGLKWHDSVNEAVQNMVHVKRVFEPDPGNVRIYTDLYEGVYTRMYAALSPLYGRIRKITGYPV